MGRTTNVYTALPTSPDAAEPLASPKAERAFSGPRRLLIALAVVLGCGLAAHHFRLPSEAAWRSGASTSNTAEAAGGSLHEVQEPSAPTTGPASEAPLAAGTASQWSSFEAALASSLPATTAASRQATFSTPATSTLGPGPAIATPSAGPGSKILPNRTYFGDFYDSLQSADEVRYVTAAPLGGISNQMKGIINLLVLAKRTGRGVILPPCIPNLHQVFHRRGPSYFLFYDIPRLAADLGLPILDWNVIRAQTPYNTTGPGWEWVNKKWRAASEPLKCFVGASVGALKADGGRSIASQFETSLFIELKTEYSPSRNDKGTWRTLDAAVEIMSSNDTEEVHNGKVYDLGCLTQSYWLQGAERESKEVLAQMRFSELLENHVDKTIAATLGTDVETARKNGFLTVHLRRNDIIQKCKPAPKNWKEILQQEDDNEAGAVPSPQRRDLLTFPLVQSRAFSIKERGWSEEDGDLDESPIARRLERRGKKSSKAPWRMCYSTDSYVIRRVNSVRAQSGDPALPVIIATDDTDPESLALFDAQEGWHRVVRVPVHYDGEPDAFEDFFEVMTDTALLTRGQAFLGTSVSTMSRLAGERGARWYKRPAYSFDRR